MLIKPIGEGKHNNLHFMITDKKAINIKVVVFLDTCDAYIVNSKFKINIKYLDLNAIYEELRIRLSGRDYELKTPIADMLRNFGNTENIIKHYGLNESNQD